MSGHTGDPQGSTQKVSQVLSVFVGTFNQCNDAQQTSRANLRPHVGIAQWSPNQGGNDAALAAPQKKVYARIRRSECDYYISHCQPMSYQPDNNPCFENSRGMESDSKATCRYQRRLTQCYTTTVAMSSFKPSCNIVTEKYASCLSFFGRERAFQKKSGAFSGLPC